MFEQDTYKRMLESLICLISPGLFQFYVEIVSECVGKHVSGWKIFLLILIKRDIILTLENWIYESYMAINKIWN